MVNIDLSSLFSVKGIIIYVLIINIISFLAMGIDKLKAKKGAWRIPEATLFLFVLLGGGIGGNIGMFTFHHKTKKAKFRILFPLITIIEIVAVIYFAFFFKY